MRKRLLSMLIVVGLLLTACGGASQSTTQNGPKHGGTLTVAFNIEPDTLDPQAQTTTAVQALVNMVVERLVAYDDHGKLVPQLATSWQPASDGLSWTFTLRSGVKFQDGEPFNAQAVKLSLDRLLSPTTFKAQVGVLRVIKDVEVVDSSHVKVSLKQQFAPFLDAMTQTVAGIIAPNSMTQTPNTPATIAHPVGTGPYELKEYVKGDHLTLTAFSGYWGHKPGYDTQVYKIVPEATQRESLVKAGQADVAFNPPPNDLPALKNSSDVRVMIAPSDRTIFVSINTQDRAQPLLQKKEVRQALNYAVDKSAMIKNLTFGSTTPMTAPMAPGVFGYCQMSQNYNYNPDKARSLLQQAGATGMSLKLLSPQGRYTADYNAAQAIAGSLRSIGLKVDLPNSMDWASYLGVINVAPDKATTDLHVLGWAPGYLDASQAMLQFQKSQWPAAGLATSYYTNPQVEDLVTKANTELGKSQRQKDYCQAARLIWDDAPWIFLWVQENPVITSSKVKGVYGLPNEQVVTSWAQPA